MTLDLSEARNPVLHKFLSKVACSTSDSPFCPEAEGYFVKELNLRMLAFTKFGMYDPMIGPVYVSNLRPFKKMLDEGLSKGQFYVYHDLTCILFDRRWLYDYGKGGRYENPGKPNDMTFRVFWFKPCIHKLKLTHSSNCYREYVCDLCGYQESEDSSG